MGEGEGGGGENEDHLVSPPFYPSQGGKGRFSEEYVFSIRGFLASHRMIRLLILRLKPVM